MSRNCGNCKSIGLAIELRADGASSRRLLQSEDTPDRLPSPLAPAGGVGRGRTAMFSARSRFSKCDCFVFLGLVVSFIAVQLLVRLVSDCSNRAV